MTRRWFFRLLSGVVALPMVGRLVPTPVKSKIRYYCEYLPTGIRMTIDNQSVHNLTVKRLDDTCIEYEIHYR